MQNKQKRDISLFPYNLLSSLFWSEGLPASIQFILSFLSNAQFLAIIVYGQILLIVSTDGDSFTDKVKEILSLGDNFTADYLDNFLNSFVTLMLIIYLIMLLVLSVYVIQAIYIHGKISNFMKNVFVITAQLHIGFFSFIVHIYLIGNLSCRQEFSFFGTTVSSQKASVMITHILEITFNLAIGIIAAEYSYDPFRSSNIFASHSSNDQIIMFLYKSVAGILLGTCSMSQFAKWFFVSMSIVFCAVRVYNLVNQWPYYDHRAMKLNLVIASISCFFAILNFIGLICSSAKVNVFPSTLVYVEILILPIVWKFASWQLQKTLSTYVNMPLGCLKTSTSVYKKLYSIKALMESFRFTVDNNRPRFSHYTELYLFGLIKAHATHCFEENCLCKLLSSSGNYYKPFDISELRTAYQDFTLQLEYETLSQALKIPGNNNLMDAHLAHLLIENKHFDVRSIITIYSASKNIHSFKERLILHSLKQKIQEKIFAFFREEEGCLNIKEFVDYQKSATTLPTMLSSNIAKYIEFWEIYMQPEVNLMGLLNKSIQIEAEAERINASWNHFAMNYSKVAMNLYPLYGLYLIHVRNAQYSGEKILRKHRQFIRLEDKSREIESEINKYTLNDKETGTIYFSMNKESLGKILNISHNIIEQLGCTDESLVGKNVISLFPSFLHTTLAKALASDRPPYLHQNIPCFVNDSQGNLVPCYIYLSFNPYLDKDMSFICFIRFRPCPDEIILVNDYGKIEGWTKEIGDVLGLHQAKTNYIHEYCREWNKTGKSQSKSKKNDTILSSDSGTQAIRVESLRTHLSNKEDQTEESHLTHLGFNANHRGIDFNRELIVRTETKSIFEIPMTVLLIQPLERYQSGEVKTKSNVKQSNKVPLKITTDDSHRTRFENSEDFAGIEEIDEFTHLPNRQKDKLIKKVTKINERDNIMSANSIKKSYETKVKVAAKKKHAFDRDSSSVTSTTNLNIFNKLEEAIYAVPKGDSLKFLYVVVLVFFMLCGTMLIANFFTMKHNLNLIQDNASTVISFTESMSYVIELNRRMRQLMLFPEGFLTTDRHLRVNQPNFLNGIIVALPSVVGKLNNQSRAAREGLSKIDQRFLKRLYEKDIPLINRGESVVSNRKISLFDMPSEVITSTLRVATAPGAQINKDNIDLVFILNNTLNDYLIKAEGVGPIILQDTEDKITSFKNVIIISMTITLIFGAFLLSITAYEEWKHMLQRDLFIDILLRTDEHHMKDHLALIKKLHEASKLDFFSDAYISKLSEVGFYENKKRTSRKSRAEKDVKNYVKKKGMRKGINQEILKGILLAASSIFLFNLSFIVLYTTQVSSGKSQNIADQIERSVEANYFIYQLRLAEATVYSYVHERGDLLLRNNPMGPEIERILQDVTHFQDFLLELERSVEDPEIKQIIKGDLCDVIFSVRVNSSQCKILSGGAATRGMSGLVSYAISGIRDTKDAWDGSNHTQEAMHEAFQVQGLVDIEATSFNFLHPGFEKLQGFMKNQTIEMIKEHQTASVKIIVTFIVLYASVGLVQSAYIREFMTSQRAVWRKMIRHIPVKILLSNKQLKTFLINNCDHILDSVKNKLYLET